MSDPSNAAEPGHWGIAIMRERAQEAGISFSIDSGPGAGTRIALEFTRAPA